MSQLVKMPTLILMILLPPMSATKFLATISVPKDKVRSRRYIAK
jgi:hypothetical protein